MKPKKFNRLSAAIPVVDLQETLDYYKEKFGFYEEWADGPDGGLRRDEMDVLSAEDAAYAKLINTSKRRFVILWFVDNVDEIYRELGGKKDRDSPGYRKQALRDQGIQYNR